MNEQVTEPCQLHPPVLGDAKLKFRATPRWPSSLFTIYIFFLHWVFAEAHRFSLVAVGGDSSLVALLRLVTAVASIVEHGLYGPRA